MSYVETGPLSRFLAWWWPSLVAWLPEKRQRKLLPARPYRYIRWDSQAFDPQVERPDDQRPAVLLLPAREALVRTLQLPANAAARLLRIAHYEVERQTPFTVDQVYFAAVAQPASRQRSPYSLLASLIVVPRHMLDRAVTSVSGVTTRLIAVDVIGTDNKPLGANLLPPSRRYRTPIRWRNWNIVLGVTCCIALIGIAIAAMHARQRGMEHLEEQAGPLLAQTAIIRQRQAALKRARSLSVPTEGAQPTTMLDALSELSAALPLSSHLAHIEFKGGVITAQGQTDDLTGVLEALRANRLWKTPELTGSRTLLDGKSQAFSLRLRVRQHAVTRAPHD